MSRAADGVSGHGAGGEDIRRIMPLRIILEGFVHQRRPGDAGDGAAGDATGIVAHLLDPQDDRQARRTGGVAGLADEIGEQAFGGLEAVVPGQAGEGADRDAHHHRHDPHHHHQLDEGEGAPGPRPARGVLHGDDGMVLVHGPGRGTVAGRNARKSRRSLISRRYDGREPTTESPVARRSMAWMAHPSRCCGSGRLQGFPVGRLSRPPPRASSSAPCAVPPSRRAWPCARRGWPCGRPSSRRVSRRGPPSWPRGRPVPD